MSFADVLSKTTPAQRELMMYFGFEALKLVANIAKTRNAKPEDLNELLELAAQDNKTTIADVKV